MLRDITMGQYFPAKSVLHRMDPRMKLILTVFWICMVFVPKNWYGLAATVAFLFVIIAFSGLPVRLVFKSIKPIIPVIIFTSAINVFYVSKGTLLVEWWIFRIHTGGLITAVFIAIRILCLIVGSSLLTYTTLPTALTDALERLLKPLKIVRLPVHDLAMMMTIALRFIPTLIEETDKIMSAQKARGADFESGKLLQRVRAMIPILIPLLASSFRRAYELATAMECRCYHGGDGRTRMKELHLAARDYLALILCVAVLAGLIVLNVFVTPVI